MASQPGLAASGRKLGLGDTRPGLSTLVPGASPGWEELGHVLQSRLLQPAALKPRGKWPTATTQGPRAQVSNQLLLMLPLDPARRAQVSLSEPWAPRS